MKRSVVMIFLLLLAMAAVAMAADPWTGTWKLNPAKSKSPGGGLPHPSSTNVIEVNGDMMHLTSDQTSANGRKEHVEYTAALDGKEYPVEVSPAPATPQTYTISLKRIDSRTREFVEDIGTFTIKGRDVLSEDGKSFSRIVNSKDAQGNDTTVIQFFEKQ